MSKIIVDSDEYFKLKEKLNKLSETYKSLKEKYVRLQKKSTIDVNYSTEAFDKIKNENLALKKDITSYKHEICTLKKEKSKLIQDITLFKKENDSLKSKITDLKNKNKELHSMIEEFENRKKTKNELNHKKSKKEDFDINVFDKEYLEFIKKLKENSQK